METFLIRALQLILSLSLLVIIHEGGHFFLILGFHCLSLSQRTVIRNME